MEITEWPKVYLSNELLFIGLAINLSDFRQLTSSSVFWRRQLTFVSFGCQANIYNKENNYFLFSFKDSQF
jgi:hypothetical protein